MDKDVKYFYENTDWPIHEIANEFGYKLGKVWKWIEQEYSKEYRNARKSKCYRNSKLGDKNPRFQKPKSTEQVSDGKGYLIQIKPEWYTGRKGCKHVFVHHLVMCEALGLTEIPKGFCVHHVDGNKTNNDLVNLALMTTAAHMRLHQLERATTSRKA